MRTWMLFVGARRTCLIYLVLISTLQYCECACSWPAALQNATWQDSRKGDLTFTDTTMTGYVVDTFQAGQTFTSWECYDESYFATENLLIFRSSNTVVLYSTNWYGYFCWQMTELSSVSYRYYTITTIEPQINDERGHINFENTVIDKNVVCDTTKGASGKQFNVIVQQGQGATAALQCPHPLLGRFDFTYTTPDGTLKCTSADHVNVCSTKTTVTFDVACAGQSMVYADGDVHCVDSQTFGTDTYVQFYNPQTTVDDSTTYIFSCMAISQDSLSSTIVYGGCADDQTPANAATDGSGNTLGAIVALTPYEGGCTWPADFVSSTWHDNTRGTAVFLTDTMSGWTVTVDATGPVTVTQWECLDTQYFSGENTLLFKSTETFVELGTTWVTYLCLHMTKLTDTSYVYNQIHETQTLANDERIAISSSNVTLSTRAEICHTVTVPTTEFGMMVKDGGGTTAKQNCADPLLAKYGYETTDTGSTTTCAKTDIGWDVCTDRQAMTFNYTLCNTQMAFSTAGVVNCVYTFTSGNTYQMVYNTDASPANRFTCFVVSSDGLTASMAPDACTSAQTPTTYAQDSSGSDVGALLTMVKDAFTTSGWNSGDNSGGGISLGLIAGAESAFTASGGDSGDSGDSSGGGISLGLIAGAVGGVLALIAIAIIIYCCYKKHKKRNNVSSSDASDPEKPPVETVTPAPVTDTKPSLEDAETMTVEEVQPVYNPAFREDLPRNTLTPLHPKKPKPGQNGVVPKTVPPIKGSGEKV